MTTSSKQPDINPHCDINPHWIHLRDEFIENMRIAGVSNDDIRGLLAGTLVRMWMDEGLEEENLIEGIRHVWKTAIKMRH